MNLVIPNFNQKGQFQNLTSGQIRGHRSSEVKVGHIRYHSIRDQETNALIALSIAYHHWFKSYWQKSNFLVGNWAGPKIDLTRGHENEKSEIYILLASTSISHPQSFKSFGLQLCPHREVEVWSRSRGAHLTLTWPGDLTFWPRKSKFAHKVCSWIVSRYAKFGGAARRRF